jgi:hypothetical protein
MNIFNKIQENAKLYIETPFLETGELLEYEFPFENKEPLDETYYALIGEIAKKKAIFDELKKKTTIGSIEQGTFENGLNYIVSFTTRCVFVTNGDRGIVALIEDRDSLLEIIESIFELRVGPFKSCCGQSKKKGYQMRSDEIKQGFKLVVLYAFNKVDYYKFKEVLDPNEIMDSQYIEKRFIEFRKDTASFLLNNPDILNRVVDCIVEDIYTV